MRPEKVFVLIYFAVCVSTKAYDEHISCDRDYKKIGCYEGQNKILPELLVSDRILHSKYSQGLLVNWKNFTASLHSLACRCSIEAKKQSFKFFGIRYFGECYGGNDLKTVRTNNPTSACVMKQFQNCDDSDNYECAGKANGEYIYEIMTKDESVVNGGFGPWSEFGPCSVTCGLGVQARERNCDSPEPKGQNAKDCEELGPYTETKSCDMSPCAKYSEWSNWTVCQVSCGGGEKSRTRSCMGIGECIGPSIEVQPCNTQECHGKCEFKPGDGIGGSEMNIGTKASVGECIMACEQLRQNKYPDINGVTIPASGSISCYCERRMKGWNTATHWKSCITSPLNGGYSSWSTWSSCSLTCNGGLQSRTRTCTNPAPMNGGKDCKGNATETRSCNVMKCPGKCEFKPGDGIGGSEMNIGTKASVGECIMACEQLRQNKYPDINGVTIPASGSISCYCERRMKGWNRATHWKSCITSP